jgi:hypothetical protein
MKRTNKERFFASLRMTAFLGFPQPVKPVWLRFKLALN